MENFLRDIIKPIRKIINSNNGFMLNNRLEELNNRVKQAYNIIEKSSIVVFEWTLSPEVPTKFVTENISQFGYTQDDFYNGDLKDYWEFVYEEDREKTQKTVWENREKQVDEYKHEYRVVCKNGEIRWVEEWTIVERTDEGDPISEKGILRDITEQVSMSQKLKESKDRYQKLFKNACAIIFTFDLDGNITSANNSCIKITGYEREKLLKMNIKDFISDKHREKLRNTNLLNIVEERGDEALEVEIIGVSNRKIILELRLNIIYHDNKPSEIQGVAQDISYRKIAEKKIRHLSFHDPLTGVYNRAYFDEAIKKLKEEDYPISIIVGDMNGLKLANDAFGHSEGDRLLKITANIFKKACRKEDIVARLGGDEFAVILKNADDKGAKKVCDRIIYLCNEDNNKPMKPSIALGYSTSHTSNKRLQQLFKEADDNMYRNKLNESKSIRSSIISTLQATLEEKTFETKEHCTRLKEMSLRLGRKIGLSDSQLDELAIAAVMHDIGKIAIPHSIILKPGKLNHKEWELMKKHTEIGYHIMLSSPNIASVGEYVLAHHERWDGNGYPRKLKGEEIPIIARIISITDAFDVMTHERPYSPPISKEAAIEEIKRCSGSQFDPNITKEFLEIL